MKACTAVSSSGRSNLQAFLLIGCGVVAAAQIGKAIISIPLIRSECKGFTLRSRQYANVAATLAARN